jgi:hypothetical protein
MTQQPSTAASAAPSASGDDSSGASFPARAALRALVSRKDALEAELEAFSSQAAVGQKLVDDEGFPRPDLDVHAIRNARAQLAR